MNWVIGKINWVVVQAAKALSAIQIGEENKRIVRREILRLRVRKVKDIGDVLPTFPGTRTADVEAETKREEGPSPGGYVVDKHGRAVAVPAPVAEKGGPRDLSRDEIRMMIEEAVRAGVVSERGRPIMVEGSVTLDGEKMGRMKAAQDRESAARRGHPRAAHRRD